MQERLKVGVVMGGKSSEYEISLQTGQEVLAALVSLGRYDAVPILLTKDNTWTQDNEPLPPQEILNKIDVVFNAMHGEYGEDGRMQALLEFFGKPYTGSGVTASALAMDKPKSRALFRFFKIATPSDLLFHRHGASVEQKVRMILEANPEGPWVVKPAHCGSSVGVSIVRETKYLEQAFSLAFGYDPEILVEEYLSGTEVACGVIEDFDGEKLFVLPPVMIIPAPGHDFFDYEAKYSSETQELIPAPLDQKLIELVQHTASEAHRILGCRGYSRTDMIIHNGTPYVLEVNTLPGFTAQSLFPKSAKAAGIGFPHLIDHLVQQAIR